MDFEFTEEQRMLKQNVRRFMEREIMPHVDEWDKHKPMPKSLAHELIKKLIPLGFLNCRIPVKYSGMGSDNVTYGVMQEELRKVYASLGGVVGITAGAAYTISEYGNMEQRERYLPSLLAGDIIGCTAITEPNVGSDAASIETTAKKGDSSYIINGTKMWISNGSIADIVIVLASTDRSKKGRGISRFIVDRKESSFQSRDIPKMGLRSFPTAELVFEDCRVSAENLLGEEGDGLIGAFKGLEIARSNAALSSVGVAQAAIDASIKYAKERKQFGKTIANFQLVQELIADMVMETEAARLLAYRALSLIDKGKRCPLESSVAKAYATEMAVRVTSRAIQIHGAYGLSEEYPVERYFRDARCYTIPDGTTQIQKLIIGREVLGIKAFV